jgi:hypothetical protein
VSASQAIQAPPNLHHLFVPAPAIRRSSRLILWYSSGRTLQIGLAMQTNRLKWKSRDREKRRFLLDTHARCVSSDIFTSVCERSTDTSPSSRSVSLAAEPSEEDSLLSLASEDHSKEKYDTHPYAGKEAMRDSNSCSVTTTLPSSPGQVTPERADTAEAMDLESPAMSKSLCIPDEYTTGSKKIKMRKGRNESERTSKKPCHKGKYPSVTVVIPPLRSRTTGIARSNSQSVAFNMSLCGGGERSDDSSEGDFTTDNLQPGFSDRERIEVLDCKHTRTSTASSY